MKSAGIIRILYNISDLNMQYLIWSFVVSLSVMKANFKVIINRYLVTPYAICELILEQIVKNLIINIQSVNHKCNERDRQNFIYLYILIILEYIRLSEDLLVYGLYLF